MMDIAGLFEHRCAGYAHRRGDQAAAARSAPLAVIVAGAGIDADAGHILIITLGQTVAVPHPPGIFTPVAGLFQLIARILAGKPPVGQCFGVLTGGAEDIAVLSRHTFLQKSDKCRCTYFYCHIHTSLCILCLHGCGRPGPQPPGQAIIMCLPPQRSVRPHR